MGLRCWEITSNDRSIRIHIHKDDRSIRGIPNRNRSIHGIHHSSRDIHSNHNRHQRQHRPQAQPQQRRQERELRATRKEKYKVGAKRFQTFFYWTKNLLFGLPEISWLVLNWSKTECRLQICAHYLYSDSHVQRGCVRQGTRRQAPLPIETLAVRRSMINAVRPLPEDKDGCYCCWSKRTPTSWLTRPKRWTTKKENQCVKQKFGLFFKQKWLMVLYWEF